MKGKVSHSHWHGGEDVPESHGAQLPERRVRRKFQSKFRLDEFYQLARRFFGYDFRVVTVVYKP